VVRWRYVSRMRWWCVGCSVRVRVRAKARVMVRVMVRVIVVVCKW
jgi:hypothetical protein